MVAKLTAQSGDYIFQTPTTGILNVANANAAGAGNVTLNTNNNAIGTLAASGNNVTIANTGALVLGNVTAGGNLTVASTSTITQAIDTKVSSLGNTSFTGTGLTLANSSNQFGPLSIDVTAAGTASVAEHTTLNLASLRAATVTLKSNENIITTGTANILADNYSVIATLTFEPAANFRATNSVTVLAGGNVDLSLLSISTNLNNKTPSVIATGYKAPTP